MYFSVRKELIEAFDHMLLAEARAVSTLAMVDDGAFTLQFNDRFMHGFDDDEATDFFEIWRENGKVAERSEALEDTDEHLPNRVGTFDEPEFFSHRLQDGREVRAMGVAFVPRGSTKKSSKRNRELLHIVVAADREALDHELDEILWGTAGVGLLVLALTAGVVPLVLGRGLRPLRQLTRDVEKINANTLSTRFSAENAPTELQPIIARLNGLLDRLEGSFERERRVTSALAHELRTPIAELRSLAEVALKWPESRDAGVDRDALAISQQMEMIVTRMLALARMESQQLVAVAEDVELPQLIERAYKPLRAGAEARNCYFETQVAPITLRTDPVLLRSVLTNLLENAAEYSPDGSTIRVTATEEQNGARIRISNPAPDLTQDDLDRFFERFWRKESSRTGGLHAGLGLALVREFVHALGWTLAVSLDAHQQLTFTLDSGH